jgi:regulator of sirC expression with transglutaminase-like and TPR domain
VAAALLVASAGLALGQQRAIINYDPQAPMQAVPGSQGEEDAWFTMTDEDDPTRKVRLITDFLSDYPTSEMTHLVLQTLWQVRYDAGDHAAVIETGNRALDAYQYFIDSKLGFIDDPSRVPQVPRAMYRFADQKLNIYRSLLEAHLALGNEELVGQTTDLALEAAELADQWYAELGLEAEEVTGVPADAYEERSTGIRMFFLDNLLARYEEAGDVEAIIETSERMLEVEPDNVQALLTASMNMVRNPPEDPTERTRLMERAREYAERADAGIDDFLLRAQVSNEQQDAILGQMYATMGKANEELGEWSTALAAYQAATDAMPALPNYHVQVGYAAANLNDIDTALAAFARAHFLAPDNPDLRSTVENLYQAREGSLDGLDAYVASQGATLPD